MSVTRFSKILLDKAPKNINEAADDIVDVIFEVNEIVRLLNSIDFCSPLGFILTQTLPPGGAVDNLLKGYSKKVNTFVNGYTNKLELNDSSNIGDDIEELRISLEDLIPEPELERVIPGGGNIAGVIQTLNDSLVISNTILSNNEKRKLLKSFTNRLIPLSNPVSLTEVLISSQVDNLNETLRGIIRPERFQEDVLKLVKSLTKIDRGIARIESTVLLLNKIIKAINVLVKIFKLTAKILKKLPIPAKFVTVGITTSTASKTVKLERDVSDLEKILNSISSFLNTTIITQIRNIRREIFILLIGLNQLYENIAACPYLREDELLNNILKNRIDGLDNNIKTLENLFPSIATPEQGVTSYKGYTLNIVQEQANDNRTSLLRRYVIVTNSQNLIEYEGTPTFSNNDQTLIKEGQFFIDTRSEYGTGDNGTDNITDAETETILQENGLQDSSLNSAIEKERQINNLIQSQIQENPADKELFDLANNTQPDPDPKKVTQIKRMINSVVNDNMITSPKKKQQRLSKLRSNLITRGYTQKEVATAFKSPNQPKNNIVLSNNNIKLNKD